MKVLALLGSPRKAKSNTRKLVDKVLEGVHHSYVDTELIDITELKINYCTGCGVCHKEGTCIQKDDFSYLEEKMLHADGLVIASPVYIMHVSGQMKTLMDRCSNIIHCQKFLGKYAGAVTTTGSMGEEAVAHYIRNFIIFCGAQCIGEVMAKVPYDGIIDEDKVNDSLHLGHALAKAMKAQRSLPDQINIHQEFRIHMGANIQRKRDEWQAEYAYWKEKGWI
ncbi:MAG: flavodoxin family protein [Thermodesulfobacteriota bacterium]|nr:flavodoxin family protein [Thermodesulfobacteriota bacterium]